MQTPFTSVKRIGPLRLPHGTEELFGREQELDDLDGAWQGSGIHVVTIVAWGGVGKTSLVNAWQAALAQRD